MKKLLALLVVAVMGITAANADNGLNTNAGSLFAKNDLLGSFTLGFGDGFGQRFAIDYCVVDGWLDGKASLGIGASLNNTISWNFAVDALSVIANCSFHYQLIESLEAYAVLGIGGGVVMAPQSFGGGFDWTSAAGIRYFFSPSTALNFEVGHTAACFANLGVTFRLN
ncbi:MAG: hypothetical protein J6U43_00665 [Bacteroidales bacterium]|nr:hypothetical protein [Bacteroidales bacterium]